MDPMVVLLGAALLAVLMVLMALGFGSDPDDSANMDKPR